MTRDITSVCVGGSILGQYVHGRVFPPLVGRHILFVSLCRNIERPNWQVTLKWRWLWAMFGVTLARNMERALYIGLLRAIKHILKNSHVNKWSLCDWCFSYGTLSSFLVKPKTIGCHKMSFHRQMTNVLAVRGKFCYSTFVSCVCACSEFLWHTCIVWMCACAVGINDTHFHG